MDFQAERQLKKLSPDLHNRYTASVFGIQGVLSNYKTMFPDFTDHTYLHSMQIIDFCNRLLGEEIIMGISEDDLYVMLMAACLHDSGMGISESDYNEFVSSIDTSIYFNEKPADLAETIRRIHNELSAAFVIKYRDLFDIPTLEHAHCIAMASKGHRKVNLLDEQNYPAEYALPDGRIVHLAFIAALIRLADEMDICADRNLMFTYNMDDPNVTEFQKMCYRGHIAVRKVNFEGESLIYEVDADDKQTLEFVEDLIEKLQETLDYCSMVIREHSPYELKQTKIEIIVIKKPGC